MELLGAILTGGLSSRMGTDKACMRIDGDTMLERVAATLAQVATKVVLLGRERRGFECWPDQVETSGPLAGITTALLRSPFPRVAVVAVDNVFVKPDTLSSLAGIDSQLAVVPVDEHGVRQVTCAVYPTSIADQAVEETRAGGSIQSLLDRVSFHPVTPDVWQGWGEDGRSWFSIDTVEDLAQGLVLYR